MHSPSFAFLPSVVVTSGAWFAAFFLGGMVRGGGAFLCHPQKVLFYFCGAPPARYVRRGGPGDRKPNRPPSPDKESREYQARQRKLMLSIEAGNEIAGAAPAPPLAAAAVPGAVEPDETQR